MSGILLWSQFRDLNPGPLLYESIALPTELNWQEKTHRSALLPLVF